MQPTAYPSLPQDPARWDALYASFSPNATSTPSATDQVKLDFFADAVRQEAERLLEREGVEL